MSSPSSSSSSSMKMSRNKSNLYIALGALTLFLLYILFRTPSSKTKGGQSCGCCGEGFTPAKRVLPKEGIKSTYSVESPALKAMFERGNERFQFPRPSQPRREGISYIPREKGIQEQFNSMRGTTVDKSIATRTKEGFMREFTYPQRLMSTGQSETTNNPFVGPISF